MNRQTDRKKDYRSKTLFLENEIESLILWYRSGTGNKFSDLSKKRNFDYMELKKMLKKNEEILEERDRKEKENKKV